MGRLSRREKEVRSLTAQGRAAYGTKGLDDDNLFVTGSVLTSGHQFLVQIELYRAVGAFGETVSEESQLFPDADSALDYLVAVTGIPLSALKIG